MTHVLKRPGKETEADTLYDDRRRDKNDMCTNQRTLRIASNIRSKRKAWVILFPRAFKKHGPVYTLIADI